jgi:hypothetical protein
MPTARPIISASVGADDDSVIAPEMASTPPRPTPMPTSAVSRFMPAASREPKLTTRTRTATPTPMNSVAPTRTPVLPKALPPTATSSPASSARVATASSAPRLPSSRSSRGTVYETFASAARPSGLTARVTNGSATAATWGA